MCANKVCAKNQRSPMARKLYAPRRVNSCFVACHKNTHIHVYKARMMRASIMLAHSRNAANSIIHTYESLSCRSCASFVARRRRRCSRSLVRSGARNENKNKPLKVQRNGRLSVKYERKQSGEEMPRDSQRATCRERVHVCVCV